jgi:hypothetical protein
MHRETAARPGSLPKTLALALAFDRLAYVRARTVYLHGMQYGDGDRVNPYPVGAHTAHRSAANGKCGRRRARLPAHAPHTGKTLLWAVVRRSVPCSANPSHCCASRRRSPRPPAASPRSRWCHCPSFTPCLTRPALSAPPPFRPPPRLGMQRRVIRCCSKPYSTAVWATGGSSSARRKQCRKCCSTVCVPLHAIHVTNASCNRAGGTEARRHGGTEGRREGHVGIQIRPSSLHFSVLFIARRHGTLVGHCGTKGGSDIRNPA